MLLDQYPGAAAAYSLRKLRGGYSGSAIRVRRSSDSAEQDIGFTSSGDLDESALTTFCGASDGFVTTLYDHSGNAKDLTQATVSLQPTVVSDGSVVTKNGKPAISYPANCYLTSSAALTAVTDCTAFCIYATTGNGMFAALGPLATPFFLVTQSGSSTSAFGNMGSPTVRVNGASIAATRDALNTAVGNDVQANVTVQSCDFSGMSTFAIDGYQGGFMGLQTQQEFVLYESSEVADATVIESAINDYYGTF